VSGERRPSPFALLVPFFAALAFVWLVPLVVGVRMSLESDTLYGPSHFVGAQHYRELAQSPRYGTALLNTSRYAAATLFVVIPLGLLLAAALEHLPRPLRSATAFALVLPALVPPVVLALLFVLVFAGRYGLLNQVALAPLGLGPLDWLKDPALIPVSLLLQAVWRWTGLVTLILAAGLRAVPRAYVELARAEGADSFRAFRDVRLPLLRPYLAFCAALLFLDAFVLFSGAYVLLGASGGTADAGLLLVGYAYQTAFTYGRFGSAMAGSLAVLPAVLVVLFLILRSGKPAGASS
jgi:ABC-type sugar transport system permease subunit